VKSPCKQWQWSGRKLPPLPLRRWQTSKSDRRCVEEKPVPTLDTSSPTETPTEMKAAFILHNWLLSTAHTAFPGHCTGCACTASTVICAYYAQVNAASKLHLLKQAIYTCSQLWIVSNSTFRKTFFFYACLSWEFYRSYQSR